MGSSKHWFKNICHNSRKRAKQKGMEFNLSPEWILEEYDRMGGRCAVTGLYFNLKNDERYQKNPLFPSVDRIDSSGDYTQDNCRLVCVCANYAMNEWGEWTLFDMARGIAEGGMEAEADTEKERLWHQMREAEDRAAALAEEVSGLKHLKHIDEKTKTKWVERTGLHEPEEIRQIEAKALWDVIKGSIWKLVKFNDQFRNEARRALAWYYEKDVVYYDIKESRLTKP